MSKKSIVIAVVVVVVVAALIYVSSNKTVTVGQGRVVVGIADAATSLQGVTSVMMTVDKIEAQSAAQGWVTVSSASKQYDLLVLKQTGAVALLADANLPAGTYDQIRLTISKVMVTAAGATTEAKLPSGSLVIVGRIVVETGKTATAVLDFKTDKSLHVTGNGSFVMAPVVHLQTKTDTSVTKESDDTLKISGGKNEDDVDAGMDEHGDTKGNFELDANAKLEIGSDNVIHILGQGQSDTQIKDSEHKDTGGSKPSTESVTVKIKTFTFDPATVTVKKGTKVTWVNNDIVAHTITSDSGTHFDSGNLAPGQSYSFTFTDSGTTNYHCTIHPMMKGAVVVKNE